VKSTQSTPAPTPNPPRFLAYALPWETPDKQSRIQAYDEFIIHDVPLGSSESFLDYDGIVLFAGAFERRRENGWDTPDIFCAAPNALDLRERELFSLVTQHGKPVIFLVPWLQMSVDYRDVDPQHDLFRRLAQNLNLKWRCDDRS
jgi:hypothetical protein